MSLAWHRLILHGKPIVREERKEQSHYRESLRARHCGAKMPPALECLDYRRWVRDEVAPCRLPRAVGPFIQYDCVRYRSEWRASETRCHRRGTWCVLADASCLSRAVERKWRFGESNLAVPHRQVRCLWPDRQRFHVPRWLCMNSPYNRRIYTVRSCTLRALKSRRCREGWRALVLTPISKISYTRTGRTAICA